MSYRLTASRAAQALVDKGDRKRALEILDLASTEIPFEKYNDPRSVDDMVYSYLLAGNEKKHWNWQPKYKAIHYRTINTIEAWIKAPEYIEERYSITTLLLLDDCQEHC